MLMEFFFITSSKGLVAIMTRDVRLPWITLEPLSLFSTLLASQRKMLYIYLSNVHVGISGSTDIRAQETLRLFVFAAGILGLFFGMFLDLLLIIT